MPGTLENLPHVPENAIVKIVSYYTGKNLNLFLYTLKILTFTIEYQIYCFHVVQSISTLSTLITVILLQMNQICLHLYCVVNIQNYI